MPLDAGQYAPSDSGDRAPPLPSNGEAEQSLLGAILLNNAAYGPAADIVRPEHFWHAVNGRIFEACGKLIERGIPATPITLKNRFDNDADLAAVGGATYLARLAESAVTIIGAPHYARAIRDCWRLRQIIGVAESLGQRARVNGVDDSPEKMVEATGAVLDAVLAASGEAGVASKPSGLRSAGDATEAAVRRSEAAFRGDASSGAVMSGIDALDRITGGFQRGDLIYIGKRPSMGGTAFAVTVAMNAALAGWRVGLWSAEMSAQRIGSRMLACRTGISTRQQRQGALVAEDWQALAQAQRDIAALPLLIDDTSPIGVSAIRRRARQARVNLAIVDYLQLIRADDTDSRMPRHELVAQVSAGLRDMAKELDVPVICLAQLTPDIDKRENKRPTLADFRGSHDLEQDAGLVAMIYRDEIYLAAAEPRAGLNNSDPLKLDKLHAEWSHALAESRGRAELIVVKARDDMTSTAHCMFDAPRSLFMDGGQGRLW